MWYSIQKERRSFVQLHGGIGIKRGGVDLPLAAKPKKAKNPLA